MPEAPNHNHPDYEKTFSRVATILERTAEVLRAQAAGLQAQAEQSKLTRADLDAWIAHCKERDAETTEKLKGLIDLMDRHQREHDRK